MGMDLQIGPRLTGYPGDAKLLLKFPPTDILEGVSGPISWELTLDRKLDPKKQPGPSSAPSAQPAAEAEDDDPLTITDAQGIAHRGGVMVRGSWTPELGCLDESVGEEFRIVLLREPLSQGSPTPECGAAGGAPDA